MIGKPKLKDEVELELDTMGKTEVIALSLEHTFIPSNRYGIRPGYYDHAGLVELLRSAASLRYPSGAVKSCAPTVRFIADMMD